MSTTYFATHMRQQGCLVVEGPETSITGGAADSRLVKPGDLFVAFRGETLDGNDYVAGALERGAVAALCERGPASMPAGKTVAIASDTTAAAHGLAKGWLRECGARVVAITGTVGKTTAKELTAAALSSHFRTHHSPGNLNSLEGLPLALMSLTREHEVSVLEMGMDRKGEIARLCHTAEPHVGIVLNVGLTHVEKLGSIEAIQEEKLSLARAVPPSGTAVINADDPRVAIVANELPCRVIAFGASEAANLRRGPIEDHGLDGTRFDVSYEGRTLNATSPLPGAHVVDAALAAIGAGLALGLRLDEAAQAVAEAGVEGRMVVRRGARGVTVLDDRYNASPASMAGDLRLLRGLQGRRIAVLGKMAELGEHEEAEHRRIGRLAAECCDALYAVGEACRAMVDEARAAGLAEAHWFEDKEEAAKAAAKAAGPGAFVLVKASRSQEFETIIPLLMGDA
jgi:UDP-N-acetylmuramoyl-tripeptide--D-alanyl-D-alanine ligase